MAIRRFLTAILLLISIGCYSQSMSKLTVRDNLKASSQFQIKDSIVTFSFSDTLANTWYVKNAIHDSLTQYPVLSLGTANQVALVNSTGTDLAYSDNFKWNGKRLEVTYGTANTFVGYIAGEDITTGTHNSLFGNAAMQNIVSGIGNTSMGYQSGHDNISGDYNVILGYNAGYQIKNNYNICLGYQSGYNNNAGSNNIFIGSNSGYFEEGSDKLYIENSSSATPLIWGDFANDSVRINGDLDVTQNLTADTITTKHLYALTKSHGFFAFEDSAVVINCTQDTWVQVTNTTNTLFDGVQEGQGFDISGDTITFNADARADLHPHIIIHWGIDGFAANLEDYEVRIYNIDNTEGVKRKAEGSTSGANNRISIGTTSYDINSSFGDRYILQIMNKTNSNDFTIENGSIYIEVSHY